MKFKKVILVGEENGETTYMVAEPGSMTLETSLNSATILNIKCYNPDMWLKKIDIRPPVDDVTTEEFLELIGEVHA